MTLTTEFRDRWIWNHGPWRPSTGRLRAGERIASVYRSALNRCYAAGLSERRVQLPTAPAGTLVTLDNPEAPWETAHGQRGRWNDGAPRLAARGERALTAALRR